MKAWVHDWLKVLGQSVREPSYEYLADLSRAQLSRIPFENFTKLARWPMREPLPSIEQWIANVRDHGHGGTCFLQNMTLYLLLRELGFDAYLVRLAADHLAVIARVPELGDEKLYLDCGSIAPIFKPLRFEKDVVDTATFSVENVRIERETENTFCYVRTVAGSVVQDEWVFDPNVRMTEDEFDPMTFTPPGAHSMTMLRCQLFDLDNARALSLVNCMFTIRYEDGRSKVVPLSSEKEIIDVMADEFRRPNLPTSVAIEVLRTLGVDALKPRFELARRPRRAPPKR